jgi:TolB-like protein
MTAASHEQIVTPSEARSELSQVLASPDFAASRQLSSFLKFIVEETLAGRSDHLKERTVALGALGRSVDFDPRMDCVVRVMAGKLRRSLDRFYAFYAMQGAPHAVSIEVPKGTYRPMFRRREAILRVDGHAGRLDTALSAVAAVRPIVAVTPLKLFTGDPRERLFADLLVDDVVVRLGRLGMIEVIDCLATQSPCRRSEDLRKAALRLHANFVFGGTVCRVSARVRLTVRLIDGQSGVLVWGDQYDRKTGYGPIRQQDHVADRISTGIGDFFARN